MSSHHSSSAKVPLTIHHAAPLRRTLGSAFRSFVRTPAQLSRALSTSGATAGASPQRNPLSYDPSVGNILNELQKLQMDSDAMTVPSAGGAPTAADPSPAAAASSSLPPLSLDPGATSSADMDDAHDGPDRSQKPLHRCTLDLLQLFRVCNPAYTWTGQLQPRRVLTSPSVPSATNPYDNASANLIMSVGDLLWHNTEDSHVFRDKVPPPPKPRADSTAPPQRYERSFKVLELLGEGTFGQVVKCEEILTLVPASTTIMHQAPNVPSSTGNKKPKMFRAIKVIKNRCAYYNQALMEIQILRLLNEKYDPDNKHHLLRMISSFNFRGHLCLVFELLSVNLYELMKQNGYRGLSWSLLRMFLKQLLDSLTVLTEAKIIHCDLKPENILLNKLTAPDITLIDFGSACFEYQTVYSYIQSRFYRSPEVLLGLTYNSTIDLWSFGCIAAELYLGLPLFPGITQHNQLQRIIKFIGGPPTGMLERGKNTKKFFKNPSTGVYVLKTAEEYAADTHTEVGVHKTYFKGSYLKEVIDLYPMRKGLSDAQKAQESEDRKSFLHFLQGFLRWDATQRWTPKQALHHPFLQRQPLSTLDEAAFEKLRFVVDQPASIPSAMPPAGAGAAAAASSSSATRPAPLSSVVATAASSVASPSGAAAAAAPGPSSQLLPNAAAVVSPSRGAAAPGIGSGVSSAATSVSGHLLSNSELALRHSQQQQQQPAGQPPTARGSGSFTGQLPSTLQPHSAAPLTFLPPQQQQPPPHTASAPNGVPQQQTQLTPQQLAFIQQQQQQQQQQFAIQQQQQQQQQQMQMQPPSQYGAAPSLPQTIRQQPQHNSPQRGPVVNTNAAYSPQQLQMILQQQQAALILQQQQQQLAYAQQGAASAHLPAGAYAVQPSSQQQQQPPAGSRPR